MQSTPRMVWMCWALIGLGLSAHAQEPCPPLHFHSGFSSGLSLAPNTLLDQSSKITPSETLNQGMMAPAEHVVSYALHPALLRPQLEQLLKRHWQVQNVIWYAAYGHYWPTHYEITAPSWDDLLQQLLTPYGLRVVLHDNHTAVVEYLAQGHRR